MFGGAIDLTVTAVLVVRRFGLARALLAVFLLAPFWLYALPPQDCASERPLFRRCAPEASVRGRGDPQQLDDRPDLADRRAVLELLGLEDDHQPVHAHRLR